MSANSKIEWTQATWNPTRGCTEVSPGCKRCYAKIFAERFRGVKGHAYERGFNPRLVPEKLLEPLKWNEPRMIFVNSMSDLFHKDFPDDYIVDCARVMCMAGQHTFQVLTKRADRMAALLQTKLRFAGEQPHIWWGVSVEDKKYGVPRIDRLREAPAQVRFLSIEPLLEDIGAIDLTGISWAIIGGESGAGARPILRNWVTGIRDQCLKGQVGIFFKQWGGIRKGKTGRELEGRTYDELPPRVQPAPRSKADISAFIAEIEAKYGLSADIEGEQP